MNPEHTRQLYADFPELFRGRHRPITESLMAFGCECGDGWYQILYDLCADLMSLCAQRGIAVPEFVQIKEKFGAVRAYVASSHPVLEHRIDQAVQMSYRVCEQCGAPGRLGQRLGYWSTRCDACASREDERLGVAHEPSDRWRPMEGRTH